jgi:malate dehydrogenase
MFGYPATCKNGKFEIVKGIDLSDFSKGRIAATLKELTEERDAIKHLLG